MPDIDPALQDTAVRELRAIMADFRERFSHPNGPAQEDIFRQWEKLLWLLGLAPRERALVNALLDAALDALPADVLRAAGWVRTADVRGALRALEEEVESAAGGSVDPGYLVRRFACDRFPVPAPEAPPP